MSAEQSPQSVVVARSLVMCSVTCATTTDCYSFYYVQENRNCYIVDGYVYPNGPSSEARDGVVYYSKPSPDMLCKFLLNYRLNPHVGLCYKIHESPMEFYPAREACQAEDGDLASAKTTEIRNFYKHILHMDPYDVFFGATDAGTPGVWRWMDGSLWSGFTVSASRHCLEYYHGGHFDLEFCHGTVHRFACEIALPTLYY